MAEDSGESGDRQLPGERRRALGARIAEGRREKGWTQRELGRRTGIRFMRLSKLENGHATPNLHELLRIADALDAGLDELVRGVLAGDVPARRHLLPELREITENATPEEQAALRTLLPVLVAGFKAVRRERRRPPGSQAFNQTESIPQEETRNGEP